MRRALVFVLAAIAGLAGAPVGAQTEPATPDVAARPPDASPADETPQAELTAREIYRRVLRNRFDSAVQELFVVSSDRAGNEQGLRMRQLWKRYPEGSDAYEKGVLSRTIVRYLEPPDLRKTGYLVINKQDRPSDQFIYLESQRRVRRINLRSQTVVGTDLSIEDLVPRELDDADYARTRDTEVDGTPCFVVDATPRADMESVYSKFQLYVEKEHYVPIRVRYWDRKRVEIKELRSPVESIRQIEGVWIPIQATMRHLLEETRTTVSVDLLVPDADLPDRYFTQRQLQSKRLHLPDEVMARARRL
ncbi:MAG: outer membrane lipoprotein-sorting protein [Myxococcales bacterium]|nr:outer membrane lipoprotein-sorting protein [Myxococcales bacterium]